MTINMETPRASHTATLLSDGTVLVTGGDTGNSGTAITATAEIFDPIRGSFAPTGSMGAPRGFHTATLLRNGKVLVVGGRDSSGGILATAELFDPANKTFTAAGSMSQARARHTATLLGDGKVLVAGGGDLVTLSLGTAELFDPASGSFTPTGDMATARTGHTATLRNDGTVLVTGRLWIHFFCERLQSSISISRIYLNGRAVRPRQRIFHTYWRHADSAGRAHRDAAQ